MSKLKYACLTFCALAVFCAIARAQTDADRLFQRAVELHKAGDIEGAIGQYKAALLINPRRVDALSNLGAALVKAGRFEEAIEQYKKALALSGNIAVRFNLALAYYKAARFTEAAEELSRVIARQPGKNAVFVLADCYLRLGEHKKVISLLSPYEAAYSGDRAFAYMLGAALIRDDQTYKGQQLIDRILRDGDSAEAQLLMGATLMKSHDYPGALKRFERAVELNPALPTANSLHAQALMRTGDTERAVRFFQKELEINPNDFESNLHLGRLLKQDQKNEEALRYFERALLVRPGELNVRYFIGSLHIALGNVDRARQVLEGVVKEAPDFVEAHVSLATVYYRLKRREDGDRERAIIEKLNAERQSKTPGAQEGLGPAYRGEKIPEQRKPPQ